MATALSASEGNKSITPRATLRRYDREFFYEQSSGRLLFGVGKSLVLIASCYAGAPGCVNDPNTDHLRSRGPLPKGRYTIVKRHHSRFASPAFFLEPAEENQMYGRSGFWVHGDNAKRNRSASTGCIVTSWVERTVLDRTIKNSGCRTLRVIA
ncbi:tlde1 domain-containing protein [Tsuneonella suprasediminis]|uniref:tlde1 domain-containing protein n=1 Tax=Tsuneonella suprasediminis TaxID=2306996 RepID=UPI0039C9A0D9